ncbi:MAG: hypothetical protein MZW92_60300 [Comamonadaceae bacterium]|nr:hypothetical protein [Comamonadaceae bacterium]
MRSRRSRWASSTSARADDFGYNQAHAEAAAAAEEDARRQGGRGGERARDAGRAEDACRA